MKFPSFYNSNRLINVNLNKYKIDWEKDGASSLEKRVIKFLNPYWKNFLILYQFRIPSTLLRADILNLNSKIYLEVCGQQHLAFKHWFTKNSLNEQLLAHKRDITKIEYFQGLNYKIIELYPEDVDKLSIKYIKEKFNVEL